MTTGAAEMTTNCPIAEFWILSEATLERGHKVYDAYPVDFREQARAWLGVTDDPLLHVCAGRERESPYPRSGSADTTLDVDSTHEPNVVQDVRLPFPLGCLSCCEPWGAILIDDLPDTPEDAARSAPGAAAWPSPDHLIRSALAVLRPGGRVGILHDLRLHAPTLLPQLPTGVRFVATVAVCGDSDNRRVLSVFEALEPTESYVGQPAVR